VVNIHFRCSLAPEIVSVKLFLIMQVNFYNFIYKCNVCYDFLKIIFRTYNPEKKKMFEKA